MAKKDFMASLEDFGEKPQKAPKKAVQASEEVPVVTIPPTQEKRSVGRPKKDENERRRTSISLSSITMGKLRKLGFEHDLELSTIIEEALTMYFQKYEAEHGAIRVPERFR